MEQLGKEKVVVPVVGKSSFVGLMTSTRRPVENYTPRPKPSVEALRTAKEESEGAYTEARSKKNALALKHNKLTREILEARERIAAAASAQQTLIELAAVDQAKPDDLLRVKKAVEDARAAEADLRVLHDGTGKALKAIQPELETLRAHANAHGKRYWARVCNGLMEELRAQVGEKVLAMYAAHSLGAGNAQLSDLLARAFPQPKGEVLRAACEALKAKGGI